MLRNRRRVKAALVDGLTQQERVMQGKNNGESDMTDFENPHVGLSSIFIRDILC